MPFSAVDIGTLINRSKEIRGGQPCISGTGVSVQRIIGWYRLGLNPEEIAERIGHLSLAQVHAAIAYYHSNRDEIESLINLNEAEGDRIEREHYLAQKIKHQ